MIEDSKKPAPPTPPPMRVEKEQGSGKLDLLFMLLFIGGVVGLVLVLNELLK